MSATYLSFAIIKLSNKISGVMDQSSRPTAAYRQTTHIFRINMYDYDVNVSQDKKIVTTTTVPCIIREQ